MTHALEKIVHSLGLCHMRQHAVPLIVVEADFDKVEIDLDNVGRGGAVVPRPEVVSLGVAVGVEWGGEGGVSVLIAAQCKKRA